MRRHVAAFTSLAFAAISLGPVAEGAWAGPVLVTPGSAAAGRSLLNGAIRSEPRLVVFEAGDHFVCDGGAATPLAPPDITPAATNVMVAGDAAETGGDADAENSFKPPPVVEPGFDYHFTVSEDGRVLDLAAEKTPRVAAARQPFVGDANVEPALAALRFAAGHAMTGCHAHVVGKVLAADAAGRAQLLKALTLTPSAAFRNPLYRAALPALSDCYGDEPLHSRVRYYAGTDEIVERPGERAWSALQFDVAPNGSPRKVQVAASSGSPELDRRAVRALGRSRFAPKARRGCMLRYYDQAGILAAPPEPPAQPTPGCPVVPALKFILNGTYPPQFAQRRIEGYALVRFDVAPWGQVGQVKVLKAEPAEAFGSSARAMVLSAHAPPGSAATGCVQPIRFRVKAASAAE